MDYSKEEYVKRAEEVCTKCKGDGSLPTTSQLRNFLAMVNSLSDEISGLKLESKEEQERAFNTGLESKILFLKAKLVYKAKELKGFYEKAELLNWIEYAAKGMEEYDRFAKYVEALVAYHKFVGGKE